jgi:hypothetical protein
MDADPLTPRFRVEPLTRLVPWAVPASLLLAWEAASRAGLLGSDIVNSHSIATPFRVQFRPPCESRMGLSM